MRYKWGALSNKRKYLTTFSYRILWQCGKEQPKYPKPRHKKTFDKQFHLSLLRPFSNTEALLLSLSKVILHSHETQLKSAFMQFDYSIGFPNNLPECIKQQYEGLSL